MTVRSHRLHRGITPAHWLGAVAALVAAATALAHGTRAGDVLVDHPYATPTPARAAYGAVYFRALVNRGRQGERLVGASTPRAASVEIHRSSFDGDVMRMRAVASLGIPAGATLQPRHGGDTHLMLVGLKAPLKDGERFPLRLRFELAGEHEVMVWVQTPRAGKTAEPHHH